MKVQVKRGSYAESYHHSRAGLPGNSLAFPKAIAPGLGPSPIHDLLFHGGRTVPNMQFQNLYVGGSQSWRESDITSIDKAISTAMTDKGLNNVMVQYFPGKQISCSTIASQILTGTKPAVVSQGDVESLVTRLFRDGKLGQSDLDATIFNFILPSGSVLNTNAAATGNLDPAKAQKLRRGAEGGVLRESSSLNGLGGFHGSVHVQTSKPNQVTLFYSVNAFSETLPNGKENGIAVFDQPWKNVVATLYHEMSEYRTDPDVDDAIAAGNDPTGTRFLGWTSRNGEEIGDFPIFESDPLTLVFKEVKATGKKFFIPIQFQYSNAVHGPEGPIKKPHQ